MAQPTPLELSQLVEYAEARAFKSIMELAPPDFAQQFGLAVKTANAGTVMLRHGIPIYIFNRAFGMGLSQPVTEAAIDEIIVFYKEAGANLFGIQISPEAQPKDLPRWLEARGLHYTDNWAKVIRGNEPAPAIPTDLRIEQITVEQRQAFADVCLAGFGMPEFFGPWTAAPVGEPNWQHYVAYDGDIPVTSGALYIGNEVGWLGLGATRPEYRKRGGQGAIMARRINDALEMGCKWVVTETGEDTPEHPNPSYHNMLRTGFRLLYQRPNYVYKAEKQ